MLGRPGLGDEMPSILHNRMMLFFVALSMLFVTHSVTLADFTIYEGNAASELEWQVAAAVTNLEDFESYSAGTQIDSLPALGINFDPLAGGGFPCTYSFTGTQTPHGKMQLGNFPNGINSINRWDDIVISASHGREITAMGFWNGDGQSDTMTAYVYDFADNLIGSIGAYRGQFAGFISDVPIWYVILDGDTGDGWNHVDGLQTNAVPEPLSGTLLVVAGCATLLRRKRFAQAAKR